MAWLSNWRMWVVAALLIWSILLIHPFSKEGLEITGVSDPASELLKEGDIIFEINRQQFNTMAELSAFKENFDLNDTVDIEVKRETYPYSYISIFHNYIPSDNSLNFYTKPSPFTRLSLSYELVGGTKVYADVEGDVDRTVSVLEKRFPQSKIKDYSIEKLGSGIAVSTSEGDIIASLLEVKGHFEAKIGNDTYFTSKDVDNICLSGVECGIFIYQVWNGTNPDDPTEGEVVWRYGFEVRLNKQASERFADLTKGLSIKDCAMGRCTLDKDIEYYLDGELIGSEPIASEMKGGTYDSPAISGIVKTEAEAKNRKTALQAIMHGEVDAEVTKTENIPPTFTGEAWGGLLLLIVIMSLIGPAIIFIQTKKAVNFGVSLLTVFSDWIIVLGVLAGLRIVVTSATFIAFMMIPLITAAYQNTSVVMIKKTGMIRKKISELNSKFTKFGLVLIALLFLLNFFIPQITVPLLIYSVIVVVLTKGLFYKYCSF